MEKSQLTEEQLRQPRALTIAGSDSSGGAGIQADGKTFAALGVYGLFVVTAITAQNTLGVQRVQGIGKEMVELQLLSVLDDIGADAVKTGMLWSGEVIEGVAGILKDRSLPLVIDPVLAAKRGEPLLQPEAICLLQKRLFPQATLITPNIPEAEILSSIGPINTLDHLQQASRKLIDQGAQNVLIKGGHFLGSEYGQDRLADFFFDGQEWSFFEKPRLSTPHLHGVGCTLSAAITAYLAKGYQIKQAIEEAEKFIGQAIRSALALGKGIGPVNPTIPSDLLPEGERVG